MIRRSPLSEQGIHVPFRSWSFHSSLNSRKAETDAAVLAVTVRRQ